VDSDKLVEEAMSAALEWLNFVGQERVRWGDLDGAAAAAALMKRCVDIRDEAVNAQTVDVQR
jgi:hypothetical protein